MNTSGGDPAGGAPPHTQLNITQLQPNPHEDASQRTPPPSTLIAKASSYLHLPPTDKPYVLAYPATRATTPPRPALVETPTRTAAAPASAC